MAYHSMLKNFVSRTTAEELVSLIIALMPIDCFSYESTNYRIKVGAEDTDRWRVGKRHYCVTVQLSVKQAAPSNGENRLPLHT